MDVPIRNRPDLERRAQESMTAQKQEAKMASKFVLEKDLPKLREQAAEREDVQNLRYQAKIAGRLQVGNLPDSSVLGLRDVIKRDFQEAALKTGQLVAETFTDHAGRECTRYHGDARATWKPFQDPGRTCQLNEIVHWQGKPYLANQIPPRIASERAYFKASGMMPPSVVPSPPAAPEPKTGLLSKVGRIIKGE